MFGCVRWMLAPLAVAISLVGATVAEADILATTANTGGTSGGSLQVNVAVQQSGGTALAFSTTKQKQKVVITFNAECHADGGGWMTVIIVVDGKEANPPSGNDFALCTPGAGWVGAVRQSIVVVPRTGTHSVIVRAQGIAGNNSWSLDDISLVVEN